MRERRWSGRSLASLRYVVPELRGLADELLQRSPYDFVVTEGLRTAERQALLYRRGASRLDGYTRRSRHQANAQGLSEAFDVAVLVNGTVVWTMPHYKDVARVALDIAEEQGLLIECGAFWQRFPDGPHIQLA